MKKILSIIIALTLVLGLALTASAAAADETLAVKGSTGTLAGDKLSISWTGTNVKFVTEKASSTTAIRTSDTSHFRAYQGTKTTISALNGEKLAKIEITTTGGEYLTNLKTSLGTPADATVAAADKVVTITFTNPVDSFVITAAKQWRLEKIVVTFAAAGVCNHTWDNCADTTCNNNCGETRTADTCEYTNEYDAACNKCGATRTVTLPAADSELTYEQAEKLAFAGVSSIVYKLTGEVTEIVNTTYGNLYIKDASGKTFYIYGIYSADGQTRFDAMTEKPEVGDTITVSGKLSVYNNAAQMKNGWALDIQKPNTNTCTEHQYTNEYDATCNNAGCTTGDRTVTLPAADTELTYEQADKLAKAGVTDTVYKLTGVITEIYNDTYGNMYIQDAAGNTICIYGTYSADGQTRFDAMTDKPAVGDTITVSGKLSVYNNAGQMKNGWIIEQTPAGPSKTGDTTAAAFIALMVLSAGALIVTKKSFGK